jgi:probable addiction module antidote protein
MSLKTTRFDILDHLKTPEERIAYLDAAFEEGDPAFITVALGDIARSIGMTSVAKQAGVTREALYKALSPEGDPKLTTLLGVAKALGIKLTAAPVVTRPGRRSPHRAKAGARHKGRARKLEPART